MPSKAQRRAKTRRMDAAIAALTPLGFEKKQIRNTVNALIKEYKDPESGWYFLEEDYYRLLIETMIKDQDMEQERSNVDVENEEQDEGDGASEDAMATENSGRAMVLFEAGSSSNMGLLGMGEYSADERALVNYEVGQSSADERALVTFEGGQSSADERVLVNFEEGEYSADERALVKLEDCCDMVHGIELSQVSPSSVPPEGAPSLGWISEEEEEEEKPFLPLKRASKRVPEGATSHGWISDEEEEEEKPFLPPKRASKRAPKRAPCYGWISEEEEDED